MFIGGNWVLTHHRTDELNGRVSNEILNSYNLDYKNQTLASIIAGFHRIYGRRNEGITMSLEIVGNIDDETENLFERNILIWNLYVLSREFIDDAEYENAMLLIERAEKNFSRDVILGDDIGVYHVSWLEQILLRKAEVYLLTNKIDSFQEVTDKILLNRFEFFNKAYEVTGETIVGDRCTYSCLELMALELRRKDIDLAVNMIKQSIRHKAGSQIIDLLDEKIINKYKQNKYKIFDYYTKCFFEIPDKPFDNCSYGYCKTCKGFDRKGQCLKFNIGTDFFKSCSQYQAFNDK